MKLKILNLSKTETGTVTLPEQFYEPVRLDLIKRSFLSIRSNQRQPYGAKPGAGMRHSAELSRRRRKYRGSYGFGISRVTRKILSRRGTRMMWVGALSPGTVGGRRAHPPKVEKKWSEKLNKKEKRKAIRSAIAATMNSDIVKTRYLAPNNYPFIIEDKINTIKTTKELKKILEKLGFEKELSRAKKNSRTSILLVTTAKETLNRAGRNLPGVEIVDVAGLNTELLAPGGEPGRLTLYTQSAIKEFTDKKLYTKTFKQEEKEEKAEKKNSKTKASKKSRKKSSKKKPTKKKKSKSKKSKKKSTSKKKSSKKKIAKKKSKSKSKTTKKKSKKSTKKAKK